MSTVNNKGYTFLEMVMAIMIIGILTVCAASVFAPWARSYSNLVSKSASETDLKFAIERLSRELQSLKENNITAVSSSQITFTDNNGNATNFRCSGTDVYRGSDKLLANVTSCSFTCYDSSNATTLVAANVRRIGISLTLDPPGNTQTFVYQTSFYLRNFYYQDFT